jgi:hypothetical protein
MPSPGFAERNVFLHVAQDPRRDVWLESSTIGLRRPSRLLEPFNGEFSRAGETHPYVNRTKSHLCR